LNVEIRNKRNDFIEDTTEDGHIEVAKFLIVLEQAAPWWLGDLYSYAEERAKDTTDSEHEKWKSEVM